MLPKRDFEIDPARRKHLMQAELDAEWPLILEEIRVNIDLLIFICNRFLYKLVLHKCTSY